MICSCALFSKIVDDDIIMIPRESDSASNYGLRLLRKLSLMRHRAELCDFRIDINKKHFYCHKFLLIAVSDYFNAMFNGNDRLNRMISLFFTIYF